MRGKIVNLCIGFMNIAIAVLLCIYTINVPQDKTLLTVQENTVVRYLLNVIYILVTTVAVINAIQSYNHRSDTVFNTAYIIGVFCLSFFFIKEPIIAAFNLVAGIIILFKSMIENLVEIDSTTAISVSLVVIIVTVIVAILTLSYKNIGESIKDRENKNELAYKKDYFKYITELGDGYQEPYINVKKDGKFGYITPSGQVVIEFMYDYASPFVEITAYDKKFHVALVCLDGQSLVILKNGRKVMTYRSESDDQNYAAKLEELKTIFKDTLAQESEMRYEIEFKNSNKAAVPIYQEEATEYTYRYDYNYEYDLIVTQSSMGLGDKYEFAKKNDLAIRIELDTNDLDYDENALYLFSNGTIPFYEVSKRTQGWFTSYGKKSPMTGKAQILDFFGERMLLRNYNDNTIYFIDGEGNMLSDVYKDIFVCGDGRYIVKDKDGFFKVINDDYVLSFENRFAAINPRLVSKGLYLTLDTTQNIKTNEYDFAEMNWKLVGYDGNVILDGIEQIYDQTYQIKNIKDKTVYAKFEEDIKALNYEFVGDKFYDEYK